MSTGSDSQYFAAQPSARSRPDQVRLQVEGREVSLTTDTGVFAARTLDLGTAQLLRAIPPPPTTGDLLDLGCGYGPIAVSLALRSPDARVWAVDVNERARRLCEVNASNAGADNVRVCAPEEVPGDLRFAGIWSNPPIRIGKVGLHELLREWLGRLSPGASAYLVVQRHLGADSLARDLSQIGHPTDRIASRKGYRILRAEARSPDPAETAAADPIG